MKRELQSVLESVREDTFELNQDVFVTSLLEDELLFPAPEFTESLFEEGETHQTLREACEIPANMKLIWSPLLSMVASAGFAPKLVQKLLQMTQVTSSEG